MKSSEVIHSPTQPAVIVGVGLGWLVLCCGRLWPLVGPPQRDIDEIRGVLHSQIISEVRDRIVVGVLYQIRYTVSSQTFFQIMSMVPNYHPQPAIIHPIDLPLECLNSLLMRVSAPSVQRCPSTLLQCCSRTFGRDRCQSAPRSTSAGTCHLPHG